MTETYGEKRVFNDDTDHDGQQRKRYAGSEIETDHMRPLTEAKIWAEKVKTMFNNLGARVTDKVTHARADAAILCERVSEAKAEYERKMQESNEQHMRNISESIAQHEKLLLETRMQQSDRLAGKLTSCEQFAEALKQEADLTAGKLEKESSEINNAIEQGHRMLQEINSQEMTAIKELNAKLAKTRAERDQLESQLDTERQATIAQREQVQQLHDEIALLKTQNIALTNEKDEISNQLETNVAKFNALMLDLKTCKEANKILENAKADISQPKDDNEVLLLTQKLAKQTATCKTLQRLRESQQKKIDDLEKENKNLTEELMNNIADGDNMEDDTAAEPTKAAENMVDVDVEEMVEM